MSSEAAFRCQVKQVQDLLREFDPNAPLLTNVNSFDKLLDELIKRYREIGTKWKEMVVENRSLKESNEEYVKIAENLKLNVKLLTRENSRHLHSIETLAGQHKQMKMELEGIGSWTSLKNSPRYSNVKSKVNVWNRPANRSKSPEKKPSKEEKFECGLLDLGEGSLSIISEKEIESPQEKNSIIGGESRKKLWTVQAGVGEENVIIEFPISEPLERPKVETGIFEEEDKINILPLKIQTIPAMSQIITDIDAKKTPSSIKKSKNPTYKKKKGTSKTTKNKVNTVEFSQTPTKRSSGKSTKIKPASPKMPKELEKLDPTNEIKIFENQQVEEYELPPVEPLPEKRNETLSCLKFYQNYDPEVHRSLIIPQNSLSNSIVQLSYSDSIKVKALVNENEQYKSALEQLSKSSQHSEKIKIVLEEGKKYSEHIAQISREIEQVHFIISDLSLSHNMSISSLLSLLKSFSMAKDLQLLSKSSRIFPTQTLRDQLMLEIQASKDIYLLVSELCFFLQSPRGSKLIPPEMKSFTSQTNQANDCTQEIKNEEPQMEFRRRPLPKKDFDDEEVPSREVDATAGIETTPTKLQEIISENAQPIQERKLSNSFAKSESSKKIPNSNILKQESGTEVLDRQIVKEEELFVSQPLTGSQESEEVVFSEEKIQTEDAKESQNMLVDIPEKITQNVQEIIQSEDFHVEEKIIKPESEITLSKNNDISIIEQTIAKTEQVSLEKATNNIPIKLEIFVEPSIIDIQPKEKVTKPNIEEDSKSKNKEIQYFNVKSDPNKLSKEVPKNKPQKEQKKRKKETGKTTEKVHSTTKLNQKVLQANDSKPKISEPNSQLLYKKKNIKPLSSKKFQTPEKKYTTSPISSGGVSSKVYEFQSRNVLPAFHSQTPRQIIKQKLNKGTSFTESEKHEQNADTAIEDKIVQLKEEYFSCKPGDYSSKNNTSLEILDELLEAHRKSKKTILDLQYCVNYLQGRRQIEYSRNMGQSEMSFHSSEKPAFETDSRFAYSSLEPSYPRQETPLTSLLKQETEPKKLMRNINPMDFWSADRHTPQTTRLHSAHFMFPK